MADNNSWFAEAGIKVVYFPNTNGVLSSQIAKALNTMNDQ